MISRAKYAAPTMNAATRRPRRVDRAVGRDGSTARVGREAVDYVPTLMHFETACSRRIVTAPNDILSRFAEYQWAEMSLRRVP